MRILHTVQFYHPVVGGSEEVVKQLSERLVKRGHQVTVATRKHPHRKEQSINGVDIVEFDILGNAVLGIQGETQRYQDYLPAGQFDIMMNYAAQIWSTDLVFPVIKKLASKNVIVPCGYSKLRDPQFQGYFNTMPDALRSYDRAVYLSENYQDKKFSDNHGLTNGVVIPNAASEEEFNMPAGDFRNKYGIKTPNLLLTVANHYAPKGHQFVIDAWKRMNRRDTTLVIIGDVHDSFPYIRSCFPRCFAQSLTNRGIKLLRNVPRQDVVNAYKQADVFVFGSSIECSPLVIFEAMAAGIPFVTTNCGSVSDLKEFGHIIQSPKEMAAAVHTLIEDEEQRKIEGSRGHEEWLRHYTWEQITDLYEQLYLSLLKSGIP